MTNITNFPMDSNRLYQLGLRRAENGENDLALESFINSFKTEPNCPAYQQIIYFIDEDSRYKKLPEILKNVSLNEEDPYLLSIKLHSSRYLYDIDERLELTYDLNDYIQDKLSHDTKLVELGNFVLDEANQDKRLKTYLEQDKIQKAADLFLKIAADSLDSALSLVLNRLSINTSKKLLIHLIEEKLVDNFTSYELIEKLRVNKVLDAVEITRFDQSCHIIPAKLTKLEEMDLYIENKKAIINHCQNQNPLFEDKLLHNFNLTGRYLYPFLEVAYTSGRSWINNHIAKYVLRGVDAVSLSKSIDYLKEACQEAELKALEDEEKADMNLYYDSLLEYEY